MVDDIATFAVVFVDERKGRARNGIRHTELLAQSTDKGGFPGSETAPEAYARILRSVGQKSTASTC